MFVHIPQHCLSLFMLVEAVYKLTQHREELIESFWYALDLEELIEKWQGEARNASKEEEIFGLFAHVIKE
mgnify:CR=1 FL=1